MANSWIKAFAIGVALLLAAPSLAAEQIAQTDLVTLKNGDEHLGRLGRSDFILLTRYGGLVFPRGLIDRVTVKDRQATVTTVDGDRFTGQLEKARFLFERVAFAPLDLKTEDIAEIRFAFRAQELKLPAPRDVVVMRNDDAFRVDLLVPRFVLKTPAGTTEIPRSELRAMDVEVFEEEGVRAQAVRKDNSHVLGGLQGLGIAVRTRAGQVLALPAREVAALVTDVPAAGEAARYVLAGGAAAKPAQIFRDKLALGGEGPQMVVLPAGSFRRGDLQGDGDSDELPVRRVNVAGFALGRFPVTFEEYDRFCEDTGRAKPDDEGWGRGRHPAVNVNWYEATDYALWLSRQTGKHYRLPTNAEWEYAARAGEGSRYPWGDDLGRSNANCGGCGSLWDSRRTAPAGRFPANGFGLYDMAGNVWQWVQDCWYVDYSNAPTNGSALTIGDYCDKKVVRGGSWSSPTREVRSANRWRDFTVRPSDDTGFRVARDM